MSALTVGLTGGIASGKTLVADCFMELGVPLLDADQVSRDVVAPGEPALAEIAAAFGSDYLLPDGTLNRRRLRERVFADAEARKQLEAITHPRMRARMNEWRGRQTHPYCILSIAILVETGGMRQAIDRVLVVDVPVEVQLQRLMARDDVSETLARQMIAAQATRERRLAAADEVILNDGPIEETRQAVLRLNRRYLELAAENKA